MKKYLLEIIVFTSGAGSMALELVAVRILAPYVGSSIWVLTSIIGIILASLSVGYWLGGRLADRNQSPERLGLILFWAGLWISMLAVFKGKFLQFLSGNIADIRLVSLFSTLSLFAFPNIMLGMITPYVVRLRTRKVSSSGTTSGYIYAISTLGSILGTFVTGFFFFMYFSNIEILFIIGGILASLSLLTGRIIALVLVILNILLWNLHIKEFKNSLLDVESFYNRIILTEGKSRLNKRPVLVLSTGFSQSLMYQDKDDDLAAEYTKYFRLIEHFNPKTDEVLVLGGGGFSYPKELLKTNEKVKVDVVEIDPKITEIAKKYFNLKENPRLNLYTSDARVFLNKNKKTYDAIIFDVFSGGDAFPPYYLVTKEAIQKVDTALKKNGVVVINVVSAIDGKEGEFLRSFYETCKSIFPQVFLFPVADPEDGKKLQNIILVALKSDKVPKLSSGNKELDTYLAHLWKEKIPEDMPLLLDEFAPLDKYLLEDSRLYMGEYTNKI